MLQSLGSLIAVDLNVTEPQQYSHNKQHNIYKNSH